MKLTYFAAKGVVETTRYCLAIAKQDYEDFRYELQLTPTGPKFSGEHVAAKAAGAFAADMQRLPILEVGGKLISQSKAIEK